MLRPMFDLERLEPKSRDFARELLRARPQLKRFARDEERPGGGRFLLLSIPLESGRAERLTIDTGDSERIVLRLGRWSAEFHAPQHGGRSSQAGAALDLLEEFLDGAATLWVKTRAGRYAGGGILREAREAQGLRGALAPGETLELLSFDGSRDGLHHGPAPVP
jgi:hypothetical protein